MSEPPPMSDLGRFQDAFTQALAGEVAELSAWTGDHPDADRRFAVYRNTVAKGCADALAAQFPSALRLVGEAWMRQAGVRFAAEHPPTAPSLADYGEAFPDWLADFAPAADLPWLPGVARIDWARREALFAADQAPLSPAAFAQLAPEDYAAGVAELHPAARALWFEDATPSLWAALQGEEPPVAAELSPDPQGILLVRPGLDVTHCILGAGAYVFLDACRRGLTLAEAAEMALRAQPGLALAGTFAELISVGAFAGVTERRLTAYHD